MLTKREQYIKDSFFSEMTEEEAIDTVKKISSVGDSIGFIGGDANQDQEKSDKRKHKYDVWISKEVNKNHEIIHRITDLRLIVDWATETRADIFQYDFEHALSHQAQWHIDMLRKLQVEKLDIPEIEDDRVIFRFSDKEHFLYLLTPSDLKHEGAVMGHCVGGQNYKNKIKNRYSLIMSIRDKYNMPHVTIEVDVNSRQVVQQHGKGNKEPIDKYTDMMFEYALFASDYKNLRAKEILKFLNINFITETK